MQGRTNKYTDFREHRSLSHFIVSLVCAVCLHVFYSVVASCYPPRMMEEYIVYAEYKGNLYSMTHRRMLPVVYGSIVFLIPSLFYIDRKMINTFEEIRELINEPENILGESLKLASSRYRYLFASIQSELEEINLIDGLKIRKVTREEKENIFLDFSLSGAQRYSKPSVLPQCDFVVEYTWGQKRPEANVRHVALALSLFKPKSRIDYHGSINYRIFWQKVFLGLSDPEPIAFSKPFKLAKQEAKKFLDFWKNEFLPIVKRKEHFMNIALSRFEDFRRRRNWFMGLIDLVICLEAMYLREKQELSYRLSHRCATLLGHEKSGKEKEQIRKFIKITYVIRSNLVHGKKINWEKIKNKNEIELKAYDFVEQVFEYVRQSIRRFLALTRKYGLTRKKHENFLHVVDSSIYNEKPLKEYFIEG